MADDLIMQGYAPYADTRQPWLRSPPCVLFAQSVERHESSAEVPAKLEVHLKKPVPWTNWVPWIFAAKTTASGLIALLVAFTFNLDQPYWALLTLFIVSQPQSGAVWRGSTEKRWCAAQSVGRGEPLGHRFSSVFMTRSQ